jgi:hypothetical protein
MSETPTAWTLAGGYASISLVAWMFRCWLGRFPERLGTVGDLACAVAALNVAALASPKEPLRKREVWGALEGIIRDNLNWSGAVQLTTRFFRAKI